MKVFQKVFTLFLAAALLLPPAAKLGHLFAHENHELVCNNFSDFHFHKQNLDCDIFDWQSLPSLSFELYNYSFSNPSQTMEKVEVFYSFLKGHPVSTIGLRGPPVNS